MMPSKRRSSSLLKNHGYSATKDNPLVGKGNICIADLAKEVVVVITADVHLLFLFHL
jgi:hypothetical protein